MFRNHARTGVAFPHGRWRGPILGFCLIAAMAFAGPGCSDDETNGPEDPAFPHTVPSSASMAVDVDDLNEPRLAQGGVCHALAAFVAAWTNLNVAVRVAIPVAVFEVAASTTPEFVGDQTWQWSASGGAGAQAWTALLTGKVVSTSRVDWAMRVSGTAANLDGFLWYDGYSNPTAVSGEWRYYDPSTPSAQNQIVLCTWTSLATDDRELAFENTAQGTSGDGDRLIYALDGAAASLEFEDASESTTTSIAWDVETGAGSATNAEGTCCWGPRPGFDDLVCP